MSASNKGGLGGPTGTPTTSVYVWGGDRSEVNRSGRRLAHRLDPSYAWVEAGTGDGSGVRDEVPAGRSTVYSPELLRPSSKIRPELVRSYLRPPRDPAAEWEVLRFLELPDPIQAVTADLVARPGPRVLAIGNVDLIGPSGLAGRGPFGSFVEYFNALEITLLVTSGARPAADRDQFEYSITTAASLPERFRTGATVCQWGDCDACIVPRFSRAELVCMGELAARVPLASRYGIVPSGVAAH